VVGGGANGGGGVGTTRPPPDPPPPHATSAVPSAQANKVRCVCRALLRARFAFDIRFPS
jgi:hypothetical protein